MSRRPSALPWAICDAGAAGRLQRRDGLVEDGEDAERRRRRRDLELVAGRRRAAHGDRHAVDRDRLAGDVGRRRHRGRQRRS